MAQNDIGALIVTNRGCVVGIFSDRDYAHKKISDKRSLKETSVGELMTNQVFSISPEKSIEECKTLMTVTRSSHLPVFEHNLLIGVVSVDDIVNSQK
jgi:CBS domain-containing protein